MHTLSIAWKNLKNNFLFYALYLLSVSVVITVFFAFASFAGNRVMLEKISADGRVESMCRIISACLMAFVLFYMSYSNRFFLRRRARELGIYALLGYRISGVLLLLASEDLFICGGALLMGLLSGAILHKGIVHGITALLDLSIDLAQIPLFNPEAVWETVRFIALVAVILLASNARFLIGSSLMELVRFEKRAEKRMESRRFPALIGLVFILLGYGLALDVRKGRGSRWVVWGFYQTGMLTFFLVVAGSVFFISSFLPFAVQHGKKNKKAFYTETRIITAPGFIYRIRSNARTLVMLTLLSAATLTVASVMALSLYYPVAAVSRMAPSELEFRAEDESQAYAVRQLIGSYSQDEGISYMQTDVFKVASAGEGLPVEYSLGTAKGDADNERLLRTPGFECISCSQYGQLLQAQGKEDAWKSLPDLADGECILVKYQPGAKGGDETGSRYPLFINGTAVEVTVRAVTLDNPFSFANSIGTLIVSDNLYGQMEEQMFPAVRIVSINGKALEKDEGLYGEISALLGDSPYLQGHSHRIHVLFSLNSPTFLLIGFLVALFFIAAGSILYFNNVTAVSDSRPDYQILARMGYSDRMLKKIIKRQVSAFFLIPFVFGLIDCIFATIVYKTGLMQDLLRDSLALYVPALLAVGLTAAIYLVYYLLTVHTCCRILFPRRAKG